MTQRCCRIRKTVGVKEDEGTKRKTDSFVSFYGYDKLMRRGQAAVGRKKEEKQFVKRNKLRDFGGNHQEVEDDNRSKRKVKEFEERGERNNDG